MATVNKGDQTVVTKIGSRFDPREVNKLTYKVLPDGIYFGGNPSVADVDTARFSPMEVIIWDDSNKHAVKISTAENVLIEADPTSPFFVICWEFEARKANYADFTVASEPVPANCVKLAKGIFDSNGDLIGFETDVPEDREEVSLLNSFLLNLDEFMRKEDYDPDENFEVDIAEFARVADFATNADLLDGFEALQLLGAGGGSIVDLRRLSETASSGQTEFIIGNFDPAREQELVFSGGSFMFPGTNEDYVRDDPEVTVSGTRNDAGTTYVARPALVVESGTRTTIPVVGDVIDPTVSGTLIFGRDNSVWNIVDVDTFADEFVVSGTAKNQLGQTKVIFNSGREQDEVVREIIFTFIPAGEAGLAKVKVSENDNTADFLEEKIVAGSGVFLNVLNEGNNEDLEISSSSFETAIIQQNPLATFVTGADGDTDIVTGQFDVRDFPEYPNDATAVLVNGEVREQLNFNVGFKIGEIKIKKPSSTTFTTLVDGGSFGPVQVYNGFWFPLEDGKMDFFMEGRDDGSFNVFLDLRVFGVVI